MTATELNNLLTKYPLLQRLCIRRLQSGCSGEPIPPYFACILSALENPGPRPVCFVFPKRGDAPRVASVLFALLRFKAREVELAKKLGQRTFKNGDLVRIHPTRHVYRYLGFDDERPNVVALQTLDESGKYWLDPAKVIPRLEATKAKRPLGKLDTIGIGSPPLAPLDLLLGTSTFGNTSLVETELVVLDAHNEFRDFASSVALEVAGTPSEVPLTALVPFGDLAEPADGGSWFHKWDERCLGEPLIAVTHSAQTLSDFCTFTDAKSRLIVVNGLHRLRGLQTYDDVDETQRLVLFCDQDEEQMIDGIARRGCRIWHLSGPEIVPAAVDETVFNSRAVLLPVARWARNHELLRVEDEACGESLLDELCLKLVGLGSSLDGDRDDPRAVLVSRAWRLVNDAAALVSPPNQQQREAGRQQIAAFRNDIRGAQSWLAPEAFGILTETVAALDTAYKDGSSLGVAKGAALYRLIRTAEKGSQKWVLLTRKPGHVPLLNLWLIQHHIPTPDRVVHANGLPEDQCYDQVICVSWPGADGLKGVIEKLTTPRITVLSYTFEQVWVRRTGKRLTKSAPSGRLSDKQKREFLGIPAAPEDAEPHAQQAPADQPPVTVAGDSDIWAFERRLREARKDRGAESCADPDAVPARYVGFVGDAYAYLTDTHKVSVATELVMSKSRSSHRLPERVVADLVPGDFVIFPESSERELVYEVADKLLGERAPTLRARARMWKEALQASGLSPGAFLREATELGRPKHISTIRSWFSDSSQIGPGGSKDDSKEDLELIELVTGSEELKARKEEVWNAIQELRSAHLSAGMRLREVLLQKLPQVIGQVEEKGTRVDLGDLGSAWIVQVENITKEPELRERSRINRLIHGGPDDRLLLDYL